MGKNQADEGLEWEGVGSKISALNLPFLCLLGLELCKYISG